MINGKRHTMERYWLSNIMTFNTILGLFAACCITAAFIPQAFKTIRTKDTEAISAGMYTLFTIGTIAWLVYGILSENTPVTIANAVTSVLAVVILIYKLRGQPNA